jgi:hypothetical protein
MLNQESLLIWLKETDDALKRKQQRSLRQQLVSLAEETNPQPGPEALSKSCYWLHTQPDGAYIPWEHLNPSTNAVIARRLDAEPPLNTALPTEPAPPLLEPVRILFLFSTQTPDNRHLPDHIARKNILESISSNPDLQKTELNCVDVSKIYDGSRDWIHRLLQDKQPHLIHWLGHGQHDPDNNSGGLWFSPQHHLPWPDLIDALRQCPSLRVLIAEGCHSLSGLTTHRIHDVQHLQLLIASPAELVDEHQHWSHFYRHLLSWQNPALNAWIWMQGVPSPRPEVLRNLTISLRNPAYVLCAQRFDYHHQRYLRRLTQPNPPPLPRQLLDTHLGGPILDNDLLRAPERLFHIFAHQGVGRTVWLQSLATHIATSHRDHTPISLPLNSYRQNTSILSLLRNALKKDVTWKHSNDRNDDAHMLAVRPGLVLLLDDMDTLSDDLQRALWQALSGFLAEHQRARAIVVSSSPAPPVSVTPRQLFLAPLRASQRRELALRWLTGDPDPAWRCLEELQHDSVDLPLDDLRCLRYLLERVASLLERRITPTTQDLLQILHQHLRHTIQAEDDVRALTHLAWSLPFHAVASPDEDRVRTALGDQSSQRLRAWRRSGLLLWPQRGLFRFLHPTVQAILASDHLARLLADHGLNALLTELKLSPAERRYDPHCLQPLRWMAASERFHQDPEPLDALISWLLQNDDVTSRGLTYAMRLLSISPELLRRHHRRVNAALLALRQRTPNELFATLMSDSLNPYLRAIRREPSIGSAWLNDQPQVLRALYQDLGMSSPEEALQVLQQDMTSTDPQLVISACHALGRSHLPNNAEPLRRLIRTNAHPGILSAALQALSELPGGDTPSLCRDLLRQSPQPAPCIEALRTLHQLGDLNPTDLELALQHSDPQVAAQARRFQSPLPRQPTDQPPPDQPPQGSHWQAQALRALLDPNEQFEQRSKSLDLLIRYGLHIEFPPQPQTDPYGVRGLARLLIATGATQQLITLSQDQDPYIRQQAWIGLRGAHHRITVGQHLSRLREDLVQRERDSDTFREGLQTLGQFLTLNQWQALSEARPSSCEAIWSVFSQHWNGEYESEADIHRLLHNPLSMSALYQQFLRRHIWWPSAP